MRNISIETPISKQRVFVENDTSTIFQQVLKQTSYDRYLFVIHESFTTGVPKEVIEQYVSIANSHSDDVDILYISVDNVTKDFHLLERILRKMSDMKLSRNSLLIGVGGGSTLDAVGVAASVYLRGIDYMTIPATFISMVDGIISKVAVNLGDQKNVIGAFYSPVVSFEDLRFLRNSPFIDIARGLVEVWKESIITADVARQKKIYAFVEKGDLETGLARETIDWSMRTKARYIEPDWRDDLGIHKSLSLGHTLANFIEMRLPVHHAEAVLYGVVLETIISHQMGRLKQASYERIIRHAHSFEQYFNKYDAVKAILKVGLIDALKADKISHHGTIRFVIPTNKGYDIQVVDERWLIEAVDVFTTIKLGNPS